VVSHVADDELIEEVDEDDDDVAEGDTLPVLLFVEGGVLGVVQVGLFDEVPFEFYEEEEGDGDGDDCEDCE
jgi:hypothetical protein